MLVRAGALTVPAVVGEVDKKLRWIMLVDNLGRKDNFVANGYAQAWKIGRGKGLRTRTGIKVRDDIGYGANGAG